MLLAASAWSDVKGGEPGLEGIWRMPGYARLLVVHNQKAQWWQLTALECHALGPPASIGDTMNLPPVSLEHDALDVRLPDKLATMHLTRLSSLPRLCARQPQTDRVSTFDVAWRAFQDYYAFFPTHAVDWRSLRTALRPLAARARSDDELFGVLSQLLAPLHDMHVTLTAGERFFDPAFTPFLNDLWRAYARRSNRSEGLEPFLMRTSRAILNAGLRESDPGSLRSVNQSVLTATFDRGAIGYLQILSESGYLSPTTDGASLEAEARAAAEVFRRALDPLRDSRALIVDLRINFGGEDRIALDVAGHFTPVVRRGFAKCARIGDHFGAAYATQVSPAAPYYDHPVAVLISPYTISAGDELVMLLKDYDNVVLIGETTAGAYSDPLRIGLPNGWEVTISNEQYVAPDGETYEGHGIPPDVRVPYVPELGTPAAEDLVLDKALEVLRAPFTRDLRQGIRPHLVTPRVPACGQVQKDHQ